jgi:hypothetical protein
MPKIELSNLKRNDVYEIVDDNSQETISSRWVFTEKDTNGERTVKARMVARGLKKIQNSLEYAQTHPPITSTLLDW